MWTEKKKGKMFNNKILLRSEVTGICVTLKLYKPRDAHEICMDASCMLILATGCTIDMEPLKCLFEKFWKGM